MHHDTDLINIIAVGLALAFVLGALAHKLRFSPLVGYLIAGIFVGPFTPGFVADQELANQLSELGVMLLMFGVGLHFSLEDLLEVKAIAIPGAIAQIVVATALGWALAWGMGWTPLNGFVFGLALSVASTVVLLRAMEDRRLLDTKRGRIAVGWLIVEDIAMVLALVMLPVLADIYTWIEHRGEISGRTVAWIGDSNNMCHTWMQAAEIFDFKLNISTPPGYEVEAERAGVAGSHHECFADPMDAARGADLVTTDVWTSMGFEAENEERMKAFADWCVDAEMMSVAHRDAVFMHCLPAHRGEEVTAEVMDGPQSVVWDEAENRMHVQKALMEYLLLGRLA